MLDELFGEVNFVSDSNNYNTSITVDTTSDTTPILDDLFGLTEFILESNTLESSEIDDYSEPIDPIEKGIEVAYEPIPLVEEDETGFTVKDFTEEEKITYDHIKSYEKQQKEECTHDMDKAELAMKQNVENPLFYNVSRDYLFRTPYDLCRNRFKHQYKQTRNSGYTYKDNIAMPVNFDTEYQTYREEYKQYFTGRKKLNLTAQIGGINEYAPKKIYCHWDIETTGLPQYFPVLKKQDSCVFERYLKDSGYNVKFELKDSGIGEIEYMEVARTRVLQIPCFGHMMQADFMALWQPKTAIYRYFERIISGRDTKNNLNGKKRLTGESDHPEILKPRIIVIDKSTGEKYALELTFHDSQSLHGIGKSVGDLAQVTNTPILDDKKIYNKEQKSRMFEVYLNCDSEENREKWIRYSVNSDLKIYQIFINNAKQFYNLYADKEIDAVKYFTLPRPTIGRSVADIIAARILCVFEASVLEDINKLAVKLIAENTVFTLIKHDSKRKFVKDLRAKHKGFNNDYAEILFATFCKNIKITPYQVIGEENTGDYQVSFKPLVSLPKDIQQWIIKTFCGASSAMNLAGLSDTRRINAKIQGGRCFRNKPLLTHDRGVIVDPDYDGAYSSIMRVLTLPMCANPLRTEYDLEKKAKLLTLEQTLIKHKKDLVMGLYQFFTSNTDNNSNLLNATPKPLNNQQDLLPSYHPHPSINQISIGAEWLEKSDSSYVYTNQITNSIITHWQLQIINTVFSNTLKREILNTKVVSGIMYRQSDKVETIRELLDNYQSFEGSDDYKIRGNKECVTRDRYRGWYGLNLGELIVTPVRKLRSKYPKKTPENDFYKLIGNTVYGVLCSKYFPVSNVVVANNITSGVRSGVWCLEKALSLNGSITDGGLGNALKVAFGNGKKLTDKSTIQTHRLDARQHSKDVRYGIIGGYKNIEWSNITSTFCNLKEKAKYCEKYPFESEELVRFEDDNGRSAYLANNDTKCLLDQLIYEHLAEQFPKLDLFHLPFTDDSGNPRTGILRIDCKGIVKKCVMHGASNYMVKGGFHSSYDKDKVKELGEKGKVFSAVRSYKKGYGSHAQVFMEKLGDNPDMVDRSEVFDQSMLLKIGLFQEWYKTYFENSDYQVGDTFYIDKLIREFPFSAFTFKNAEQRESWKKEIEQLKHKYGQSIESLFINEYGQVEFEKMIKAFDMWIEAGYESLSDVFGDNKTALRKMKMTQSHPEYEKLKQRKRQKRQAKRE